MSEPAQQLDIEPSGPGASHSSFWSDVRQAIRGSHDYDYTQGPIPRAIVLLAIPMVLEMLMESVFAIVDVFWVARLGADAVATVGLTESMLTLIYAMAIGLSIGVTAMVARRIGEKDRDGAARAAVQAIILGLVLSVMLGIAGIVLAPTLLALMGAEPGVIEHVAFTRVMLGGNATVVLLFLINAIFRGAGDAAIAMRVLWLANIINIVLGPLFIFGIGPFPELGVAGAAVATNIGRGTGVLFALSRLVNGKGRVSIQRRHVHAELELMWRLVRLSASGAFQVFIGMASWIGLIRVISTFGSDALAGYTIGIRVVIFALLPSWGLSNAAATMVGQALGARNPDRAERAVWKAGFYNVCFLGVVGFLFVAFAPRIASIFTQDPEVLRYASDCLRIIALGFLFYAYGMVVTQSFNGAGDTWTPTWINLVVFWLFEIPLAWVLAMRLNMGPHGAFIAITVAYTALAIVSAAIFRKGRWKTRMV
jgi:putative MATE family efflux protein